jgi:1,2-dihydroxy-3-keto-5-methylthiopentene dioxygenase
LEETPMSLLRVYPEQDPHHFEETSTYDAIAKTLQKSGIRFERWNADQILDDNASQEQILDAYHASLVKIMKEIS